MKDLAILVSFLFLRLLYTWKGNFHVAETQTLCISFIQVGGQEVKMNLSFIEYDGVEKVLIF